MEQLSIGTNVWIAAALILVAILMVYVILPKVLKNYSLEKAVKLVLVYAMMGYLSYDFYLKEKYYYIIFFAIGAGLYTYLIAIAKRK
ncbi:MAG: hypothetical protein CFE21_11785 [Bacteroidetes bacterium B1(2017)]|nr:MAG: hypothetical protein CFE21_11785 [Bacteroidetes bacterium B1(2017)]